MVLDSADIERAVCARLLGGTVRLTPRVVAAARQHRVHLLLAASLSCHERAEPEAAELSRELRTAAALDASGERDLRELLEALAADGVDVLLLKGVGLAHTVYSAPHVRPRVDTDFLVRREMIEQAERVFAAAGWTRPTEREVELSAAQRHYTKTGPAGTLQHLDVHWRIANPQRFANALSFDEMRSRAIDIPALGHHARTLGLADALFLACVHRVAHHGDEIQLLWLWDVHLLIQRLSQPDRERFLWLAEREAMGAVCWRSVELGYQYFATTGAPELAVALRERAEGRRERPARFMSNSRLVNVLISDLETLPGWRARASLIAEHVFPSRAYMHSIYPAWPAVLLSFAYGYRIIRGAPKWFARRSSEGTKSPATAHLVVQERTCALRTMTNASGNRRSASTDNPTASASSCSSPGANEWW